MKRSRMRWKPSLTGRRARRARLGGERLRHGVTALRKAAALAQDTTLSLRILAEAGDMAVYARERALVTALPFALQAQARALIGCSQFDRAYSAAEEGWRLALDIEQPWAAGLNLAFLIRIDALRGAEGLVQGRVAELQPLAVRTGAEALTASVSMSVGMLDLGLGRPGEAREAVP
jgi:hypothetical protein